MLKKIIIQNLREHLSVHCSKIVNFCDRLLFFMILMFAFFTACRMGMKQQETDFYKTKLNNEIIYSPGSLISDYVPIDINSISTAESLDIIVKVTALEYMPAVSLDPIESHTKMILISPSENAIEPVTHLTRGSRIGYIQDAEKFISSITDNKVENNSTAFQQFHGILVHGVTTSFEFFDSNTINSEQPEGFGLWIYWGIQLKEKTAANISQEIAVVTNGKPKQKMNIDQDNSHKEDKQTTEPIENEQEQQITETVLLGDFSIEVNKPIGIILPSPFNGSQAKAFAVTIEVSPPPDEGASNASIYADSFKGLIEQIRKNEVYRKSSQTSKPDTAFLGIDESIQALRFPTNRRGALLYLSQQTKSSLVEDIALSGTANVLENLSNNVIKEYSSGSYKDIQSLGWMLERSAYKVLVEMLPSDKTVSELESVLVRHTGEVGRHISSLEELVAASTGIEDLENRLIKENLIYLEDMSPASRTRAYEWLAAVKKAPDGYNPLASLKERRAILDRFENDSNKN
jgi:hypothetical protein